MIPRAVGGRARVVAVLLGASDHVAAARLGGREIASALQAHLQRSQAMARRLDAEAGQDVVRVATDGHAVGQVAADVVAATGWVED